MNKAQTPDRDPSNPAVLAGAVRGWLAVYEATNDAPWMPKQAEARDAVDVALEEVLLEQGVLSPVDVVDVCAWHSVGVLVGLETGETLLIDKTSGNVEIVEEA